jgi:predicted flap endonuclease-1-like 5' DNA nuclease
MAERFTADLLFIVIVLLIAALLGFLIGYYLRKSMKCKQCAEWEKENEALKLRLKKLEEDNNDLNTRISKLTDEAAALKLTIGKLESEVKAAAEAKAIKKPGQLKTKIIKDDLKVVQGIGPKISKILNNRGITTWKQLSETLPATISEYLIQDGGDRYKIHNPSTWPDQARLADEGKWDELKAYIAGMV